MIDNHPPEFISKKPTDIKYADKIVGYMGQFKTNQPVARALVARDLVNNKKEQQRVEADNKRKEAEKNSIIDPLTGLYNRRHLGFEEENPTGIGELQRRFDGAFRSSHDLSGFMIDIDEFKAYNDTYGHPEGDKALKAVANKIKEIIRDTDIPFRYGGEEFFIMSPETDIDGAKELAKRLNEEIALITGLKRKITVSIGVASYHNSEKIMDKVFSQTVNKKEDLVILADKALYYSKLTGKNKATIGNELTSDQYTQMEADNETNQKKEKSI